MTDAQRDRILDVCKHLISSGLTFGYKKDLKEPEYTAERGLAEIEKILREEMECKPEDQQ